MDNSVLKKAATGDMLAFEELITAYEKYIFNVAYRMLGNTEDAKDASQDTLLKAYKSISRCADIKAFKSWLTTICTNTCIDYLRKRKRVMETGMEYETEDGEAALQIHSNEPTPEQEALLTELREDIASALDNIGPEYRALVVMRDIYGLSYLELANATGQNMGTIKSRLSRARNQLRVLLRKQEQKDKGFV